MTMTPSIRKLNLTAHVASSVGWLGAVGCLLALAVAGMASDDDQTVRASYIAMQIGVWWIVLPLSFASPVTGLIQSLGTRWGLFQYYWVTAKILITIPCTFVLILHLPSITKIGSAAFQNRFDLLELDRIRLQLFANSVAALAVLLVATALSVYKPRGLTPYGARKLLAAQSVRNSPIASRVSESPWWIYAFALVAALLAIVFVYLHAVGGGFGHHRW